MPAKRQFGDRDLARVLERHLRNWEIGRAQRIELPAPQRREVEDFISVSRAVGSGGGEVARRLASRLSWPLFDRELLQHMAGDDEVRRRLYESMDERDLGWFEETFRSLMDEEFPKNDYFHRLCRTVLSIARQGSAVFLGRATDLILPRNLGLRVRIVAPAEQCIQNYARRENLPLNKARKEVERIERERAEFVHQHFRVKAEEQTRHDLIVNMERFTTEQALDLILTARTLLAAPKAP